VELLKIKPLAFIENAPSFADHVTTDPEVEVLTVDECE
jgi:hypothetical protein